MRLAFSLQTVLSSLVHIVCPRNVWLGGSLDLRGWQAKRSGDVMWLGQESLFEQLSLGTRYNMTSL